MANPQREGLKIISPVSLGYQSNPAEQLYFQPTHFYALFGLCFVSFEI